MNALMTADPKIQNAVAIGAVVTGVVAITAIASALGRKWSRDQINGIKAATAAFQKNQQK
jgi:hypothetical protein